MSEGPSRQELEAAHCWERDDHAPVLATGAFPKQTTRARRERYLVG